MGAKLSAGWLCGTMFGLPFFRHRFFEAGGWFWMQPAHVQHRTVIKPGRLFGDRGHRTFSAHEDSRGIASWIGRRKGLHISQGFACGHGPTKIQVIRDAMQIDWMTCEEITQAIPPAYTEFIGRQLLVAVARMERR